MRIITEAGYSKPTALQRKIIPLILKGKNVAAEAGEQTGKTAAFLLPLMQKVRKSKRGTKIVIMTSDLEQSRKIYKFFKLFYNRKLTKLNAVLLGDDSETKKEFKLLLKKPDVIIGTSKKIIDHIRRDNLTFNHLQVIVMDAPNGELIEDNTSETKALDAFKQDVHFIYTKIPGKVQKIFLFPDPIVSSEISDIIKRPVVVNKSDWQREIKTLDHFYYEFDDDPEDLLLRVILARKFRKGYVFCGEPRKMPQLKNSLEDRGVKTAVVSPGEGGKSIFFNRFQEGEIDLLLFSSLTDLGRAQLGFVDKVILFNCPIHTPRILKYLIDNKQDEVSIISIAQTGFEEKIKSLQEIELLSNIKEAPPSDALVLEGLISNMVQKMKEEADIEELNRIKKIIKKNVPLFTRPAFMAYLFKERMGKVIKPAREAGMTRLFVNVGKARKVFSKDIVDLFCSKLGIKAKDISGVNVLENYSFLELSSSLASRAITELNGAEIKGKKIAVNYARKKEKRRPYPARRRSAGN